MQRTEDVGNASVAVNSWYTAYNTAFISDDKGIYRTWSRCVKILLKPYNCRLLIIFISKLSNIDVHS
jgi:hypothetical protein